MFELKALIAVKGVLEPVLAPAALRAVELTDTLLLAPLSPSALRALDCEGRRGPRGMALGAGLAALLREASRRGALAYVEADYGPGRNHQAAVAWEDGLIAAGPAVDETPWDPREPSMRERPVNSALRALGVRAEGYADEWDAVGLARHDATADWV